MFLKVIHRPLPLLAKVHVSKIQANHGGANLMDNPL